jgi:hypothetical protein
MLRIIDEDIVEFSVTEVVTLAEIKTHLHITDSDNDTELTALNTQSRRSIENWINCSLVNKRVTLICELEKEWELPYGPVTGIEAVQTPESTIGSGIPTWESSIVDWSVTGLTFQKLNHPGYQRLKLIYTVGYQVMPQDLKLAVLNEIYYRYENKGLSGDGVSSDVQKLIEPYRRMVWI